MTQHWHWVIAPVQQARGEQPIDALAAKLPGVGHAPFNLGKSLPTELDHPWGDIRCREARITTSKELREQAVARSEFDCCECCRMLWGLKPLGEPGRQASLNDSKA